MSEEVTSSGILDSGSTPEYSTLKGYQWFRQGVIVVAVDAGSCLNANNIVSFSRTAVAA